MLVGTETRDDRSARATDTRRRRWRRRLRLPSALVPRRASILLLVYLALFGFVGHRLVSIQVLHAEEFASKGAEQRVRAIDLPAQRGRIYDRNGDVLATSVDAATVYADPRAFRPERREDGLVIEPAGDAAAVAAELAPLLGLDAAGIEDKLGTDAHFVYLARQIDNRVAKRIDGLDLPGIGVLTEPTRAHPAGRLAAAVLGFTGIDGDGLAGLELQYDGLLSGRSGQLALERAPGGLTIASAERELVPPVAGTDLVLTIDREIQHVAEQVAQQTVQEFDAKGAGIVVLEVGTGDVLAMASLPGYHPDRPGEVDPAARRNRAVTDMFEPGSVQKAVTTAAAIEAGAAEPATSFVVPDTMRIGGWTFSDSHRHPTEQMTVREIMEQSSNVGTILLARQLGPQRLAAYLERFGYAQPLGVGFPGESAGAVLPVEDWSGTSLPTIAIGQGVAVTLLQAANVYATLANDGVAVQPRLVRGTVGEDGRLSSGAPPTSRRAVSTETAQQVRDMLRLVVSGERGTGARAAVPGYDVAGKTGTARKPREGARGYSGEYIASFVGFAPVEDPRIVVAVMVDEPRPIYGGVVAAPAFSKVVDFALQHRRVPPDRPAEAPAEPAERLDTDHEAGSEAAGDAGAAAAAAPDPDSATRP